MIIRRGHRYPREAEPEEQPGADLMFPKPQFIPSGERADQSAAAHPREDPDRCRGFLDLVRDQICAVWDVDGIHCGGHTEAAHLENQGMSAKGSDFLAVPLCTLHHRQQHTIGLAEFQITHGVNLWEVAARLLIRWIRRIS